MDRRGFLKGAFSGGALIASARLPAAVLGEEPSVFSRRGCFERLAMSYATLEIGASKPFSILHLSDTHLADAYPDESEKKQLLVEERRKTFGGRQEEALRDSLDWAKSNTDYVLHTGDLIDFQSRKNIDLVKKYFGDYASVFACVGNHEYSPDMWLSEPKETHDDRQRAKMRGNLSGAYKFDLSFSSQIINGVNFITIDDVYACVNAGQVVRFKAEVAKGLPIVLCAHVPLYTDEIWRATCKFWHSPGKRFERAEVPGPIRDCERQRDDSVTRDFIAYLKREPLLKAILAGHEHITIQDRFSPTAVEYLVGGNFMFQAREVLVV